MWMDLLSMDLLLIPFGSQGVSAWPAAGFVPAPSWRAAANLPVLIPFRSLRGPESQHHTDERKPSLMSMCPLLLRVMVWETVNAELSTHRYWLGPWTSRLQMGLAGEVLVAASTLRERKKVQEPLVTLSMIYWEERGEAQERP